MKRPTDVRIPIEQFPIPWAESLPKLLGRVVYVFELQSRQPSPLEWLGVVSSHKSKHGFASQDWQESLHSALKLAHQQGWGIACAQETPYSAIIVHACKRFQVPVLLIQVGGQSTATDTDTLIVDGVEAGSSPSIPLHDRAVCFLTNRLFVIEVRDEGKIAQLLQERLQCESIPLGTIYLSLSARIAPNDRRRRKSDWLERGAIGWFNATTTERTDSLWNDSECDPSALALTSLTLQPIFPFELLERTKPKFLVHCTRSRRGPWPDQSLDQFHDEVLRNPWDSQPSVLETLQRILRQQRLIATRLLRNSSVGTVCFSGNEIRELLSMRRFQSHLARWDWEPYGIMIERDWLERSGVKRVSYIDSSAAKKMSDEELAFCQVQSDAPNSKDWREEQEWRIACDIRLCQVPFCKAIVFVPTLVEARAVQSLSRWPIAVVAKR